MAIKITPSGQACGATVTGVDLTQQLSGAQVSELRAAWLQYHVLSLPDQQITDDELERFSLYFGGCRPQQHACMASPFHP